MWTKQPTARLCLLSGDDTESIGPCEAQTALYPAGLNAFKGLIFLLLNIGHLLKMPDAFAENARRIY